MNRVKLYNKTDRRMCSMDEIESQKGVYIVSFKEGDKWKTALSVNFWIQVNTTIPGRIIRAIIETIETIVYRLAAMCNRGVSNCTQETCDEGIDTYAYV